ncbi:helix-turn-helix domain-containing protein [Bifidobacterium sp. 81T8]|nr:helix-turn-helix domain-containing protein [Bifidobacterium simiiventris]
MLKGMVGNDASYAHGDFLDMVTAHGGNVEAVTFECLANGLADQRVESMLHILGWPDDIRCFAVAGFAPQTGAGSGSATRTLHTLTKLRETAHDLGGALSIAGLHHGMCAVLVAAQAAATPEVTCTAMMGVFDVERPVALGPLRHGVDGASATIRAALSTIEAAPALRDAAALTMAGNGRTVPPARSFRLIRAEDALPERALLGDEDARRELIEAVYGSLTAAGPDDPTLETVSTFVLSGGSLETTAKALNVHPNTVRYRLKRAADTTGWDAADPREAYVLRTAITLGRMMRN